MPVCVFDANVPWDLDKINKLDLIMQLLLSVNFSVFMSMDNFLEMPLDVRKAFKKHQNVNLITHDESKFKEFREEIRYKGIVLEKNDSAVLYLCSEKNASYMVSSDTKVIHMTKNYAKEYSKKINAFHIVEIIYYLCINNMLSKRDCLDILTGLYSKKEIPHLVKTYGEELISDKLYRETWIKDETKSCTTKFNTYRTYILNVNV